MTKARSWRERRPNGAGLAEMESTSTRTQRFPMRDIRECVVLATRCVSEYFIQGDAGRTKKTVSTDYGRHAGSIEVIERT